MNKKGPACAILIAMMLTGCGGDNKTSEIQLYLQQLKKDTFNQKRYIKPLPLKQPTPVTFETGGRSPFTSKMQIIQVPVQKKSLSPLDTTALTSLRFMGTFTQDGQMTAVIVTPDNKYYSVKVGDTLGDQYDKIINIYSDRVIIQRSDPSLGTTTMKLKEDS